MSARLLASLAALCLALVGLAPGPAGAVVGGYQVKDDRFAFMASIQFAGQDGADGHFCGGSVVAQRWILTAAHCIEETGAAPGVVQVAVGRDNLEQDLGQGQTLRVDRIEVHPGYRSTGTFDAALVHVTQDIDAPAIGLAQPGDDTHEAAGSRLTVAGWGAQLFLLGTVQPQLRAVDVKAVADRRCATTNGLVMQFSPESEICAEELLGDSCQGDSGGPLFATTASGRHVQVGIVSYGLGCATPLFPGVYAEVNNASIHEFITSTIA